MALVEPLFFFEGKWLFLWRFFQSAWLEWLSFSLCFPPVQDRPVYTIYPKPAAQGKK